MKNKKKLTILIDMDDTIENLLESWVLFLNDKYGTNVKCDDITDWDISLFFPELNSHQVFEPLFTESFWGTVKPKEDAIKYIKKLIDDGHQVYICTTSNHKTLKQKMDECLFKWFDYLSWHDVIVTPNKQMINADILIDDGVHNLIGGKYIGILMDTPHNRKFNEKEHGIIRVKNWEEIYILINNLSQEE